MKIAPEAAQAAIEAGTATSSGAVYIACDPPVALWGGYGDLVLGEGEDAVTYTGIGDRGLVTVSSGAVGGAEQDVNLELDGIEPQALGLFDASLLRRAPVVVQRLIFDASGTVLLMAYPFTRGRLGPISKVETPKGAAVIRASVEGASRGLGKSGGRMRSDADQRLNDPDDAGLSVVSFANQKTLYLGGKPPATAGQALTQAQVQQAADDIFG
jgi:hypothetical protein